MCGMEARWSAGRLMHGETRTAQLVGGIIDLDEVMKFLKRNQLESNTENSKNVGRLN